jgi:hypothetical protein
MIPKDKLENHETKPELRGPGKNQFDLVKSSSSSSENSMLTQNAPTMPRSTVWSLIEIFVNLQAPSSSHLVSQSRRYELALGLVRRLRLTCPVDGLRMQHLGPGAVDAMMPEKTGAEILSASHLPWAKPPRYKKAWPAKILSISI